MVISLKVADRCKVISLEEEKKTVKATPVVAPIIKYLMRFFPL